MDTEFPEMMVRIEKERNTLSRVPKSLVNEMNWTGGW